MKRVVLGLLIAGLGACGEASSGVELVDTLETRPEPIVGGSTYSGLPAVGAITYRGNPHCTATLITKRKAVTAAHCVSGFSASRMRFVIGSSLSNAQYTLRVASAVAHPDYDDYNVLNDVGYITFSSDAPVDPLPVLDSMDSSWEGVDLFFVGYGVTNGSRQTGSGTKRAVTIPITEVAETQFAFSTTAGKSPCNGDSGGPAFYVDGNNYLIAGITSYGDEYCTSYGVDTRADAFTTFLGVSGTSPGSSPEPEPEEPNDPCNGETFTGRCDGSTVIWCDGETVQSISCSRSGRTCGFDESRGYYNCL